MKQYIFFNTEPNVNILGLDPILHAFWSDDMQRVAGFILSEFVYKLEDEIFEAGCLKKEWEEMAINLFNRFKVDRNYPKFIHNELEKRGQEVYNYCLETLNKNKKGGLAIDEKKQRIMHMFNLYTRMCVPGLIGPIIEFGCGGMSQAIKEILEKKDLLQAQTNIGQALSLLAQPTQLTWTEQAWNALHEIAQEIYEQKIDLNNLSSLLEQKVNDHIEKWGWVFYGYCGPAYSIKNILDDLQTILEMDMPPKDHLKQLQDEFEEKGRQQQTLMNKLDFVEDEQYMIETAQDFGYTKAYRTGLMGLVNYAINLLLRDFARKEGYSMKQIGVLSKREMTSYLQGEHALPHIDELNKRLVYTLFLSREDSDTVLTGKEAQQWVANNIEQEAVDENLSELEGTIACTGDKEQVSGIVRIVLSPKDLHKVQEGDILLSTTTIPEYVPAMRRATAIVTQTGGLTCHAAIVSREMNKPCLIGAKHLLQIFQDGDRVEVDLNKSIIRKL